MKPCKVTTTLNLPLTPEQVEQKATQATRHMTVLDNMEEEHKLIKREWNQKIKKQKLLVRETVNSYNTRTQATEVECEQHFDLVKGETWFVHEGVEYDRRALTEDEVDDLKQEPVFNDGPDVPGVDHAATAAM